MTTPKLHIAKLQLAAEDGAISLEDFVRLMFEAEPTSGDFSAPMWAEALGLLKSKLPQTSYTVRVDEAAALKGCTPDAIRKAIKRGDLLAIKAGNAWLIDEGKLALWSPGPQGPKSSSSPAVTMRFGHEAGARFVVRVDGEPPQGEQVGEHIWTATLTNWSALEVYATTSKGRRYWRLEPGDELDELSLGGFYVKGMVRVVEKINNARKADEAWGRLSNR
jgi:hypothetical protein